MSGLLAKDDLSIAAKDRYVFPNEMGDELAAKVPHVVVYTGEFDFYRRGAA